MTSSSTWWFEKDMTDSAAAAHEKEKRTPAFWQPWQLTDRQADSSMQLLALADMACTCRDLPVRHVAVNMVQAVPFCLPFLLVY